MLTISLLQSGEDRICKALVGQIKNRNFPESVLLLQTDSCKYVKNTLSDILLITPNSRCLGNIKAKCVIHPDTLIESGEATIESDCAISYGFSGRNTITASSIADDEIVISLQREIVILSGELLERQDLPVRVRKMNAVDTMALIALLLMLGCDKENLRLP